MSIAQMRAALMDAYQGNAWRQKVKAMSDNQVFAVFTRMRSAGRIKI